MFWFNLTKFVHLLSIIVGVGAIMAQLLLITAHRRSADNEVRRASEAMSLFIARRLEFPGLTLAFLSGLALFFINPIYMKSGFMHTKILLAIILIGLTHMGMGRLKKMAAAADEQDEVRISILKKGHLTFMWIAAGLATLIFILIIFKPF